MYDIFEIYPECKRTLYFVEFTKFKGESVSRWRLFKRNYALGEQEIHPFQLGSGEINPNDECIDMTTKLFLKFMVDALNEKVKRQKATDYEC